jgi:hypothetical protein
VMETREYYKIRFPANAGKRNEWHRSNNGTDRWESPAKVKSILTRGIQCGYKGRIHKPFENFEVVKFTERVEITTEVVQMEARHE